MERRQFALDSKSTTSVKPPSDQEQRSSLSLKSKSKLDTDNGPTADKGPSTSAKPSVRKDKRKRPPSPQSAPSKRQQSESTLPKAASATLADVLFNSPKAPKTSTHVNCIEDDVHTKENRKHTNREGKRPHKSSRSASRDE